MAKKTSKKLRKAKGMKRVKTLESIVPPFIKHVGT